MVYTERIADDDRTHSYEVLGKMEQKYEERDASFFNEALKNEPTLVVRVHAVTVLSEIGDESSVPILADVMKHDPSPLIRHEAAFSLGQMGLKSAVLHLIDSALNDPSEIVRHEAAAALGAIGDQSAREALTKASNDQSDEVRGSAIASLFNLDFLKHSTEHPQISEPPSKKKASPQEKRKMPHP